MKHKLRKKVAIAIIAGSIVLPNALLGAENLMVVAATQTPHFAVKNSLEEADKRLVLSAMDNLATAESVLVKARNSKKRTDVLHAKQTVLDAERLLMLVFARISSRPYGAIETMHHSGLSFNEIGTNLRIFDPSTQANIQHPHEDMNVGVADDMNIAHITMDNGDMENHAQVTHGGSSNRQGDYEQQNRNARYLNDHHNDLHGSQGVSQSGGYYKYNYPDSNYSRSVSGSFSHNNSSNYNMMGGMH